MVHEQLPVIISTLIKDNMYLQEQCRAKKTLALDIFYTNSNHSYRSDNLERTIDKQATMHTAVT